MDDIIFADGIIFKKPSPNAPDFVIGKLSFKVEEAIQFLQSSEDNGWVNCDIKVSKAGKAYVSLDTWKANSSAKDVNKGYKKSNKYGGDKEEKDIPF